MNVATAKMHPLLTGPKTPGDGSLENGCSETSIHCFRWRVLKKDDGYGKTIHPGTIDVPLYNRFN
jgi:hypothetical protein